MRCLAVLIPLMSLLLSPAQAARVVSLNLCTDEFLLLLAPEQAAAVTPLARDPLLSVVAEAARHVPLVRADAEAVLDLHPDLVLAAPYGAQATLALLARRGLHIFRIDLPEDFPAIRTETRRIADALGVPARGEALLAEMDARLAALPHRAPTPALFLEPRGWTAGGHSLAAAVMQAAGLQDTGSGRRVDLETLAAQPPALLVTETPPDTPSLATDMLWHPGLRGIPRRTVPPTLLTCGGPWTAQAAEILAR
jgi:iron complex transport system substrate-binding protein